MNTDPIPVWKFFEIPSNAIDICFELAKKYTENSPEKLYWRRVGEFLKKVKSQTTNQLIERDFDWMLKLRVLFEKDEEVSKVKSRLECG
jgi:hypothetical protein